MNLNDNQNLIGLSEVNSSLIIEIKDSYFGTTDLGAIENLIYDNADDYTLGTVSIVSPASSLINISAD